MPGRHGSRGARGGTRAPRDAAGTSRYDQPAKRTSAYWPGWFDDGDGRCTCSWSVKDGRRQVKFADAGCLVRHRKEPAA